MKDSEPLLTPLIEHLREHGLRTDGPFTLRSGEVSSWYLDARQTTFDGEGARIVGRVMAALLPAEATAVGGMTMGADPIAVATVVAATRPIHAFSVRKEPKDHGTGGRLVGPITDQDLVVVVEDTTTTGGALLEAVEALRAVPISILGAFALVDRSDGVVAHRLRAAGIDYQAVLTPADLGVT